MESKKVKEIKECLEEFKDDRIGYCSNGIDRFMLTKEDALTLINELESENESCHEVLADLKVIIKQQNDRIAELEKEIKGNAFYAKGYAQGIKNTYEVVVPNKLKQFAERLKEKIKNFCGTEYENAYYDVTKSAACNDIDETLKELLEQYE